MLGIYRSSFITNNVTYKYHTGVHLQAF